MISTLDYYRHWLSYRQWYLRIPGVQVAVAEGGEARLSAAFGSADLDAGTGLTEQHLFRIASHSKTFTAVTVLRLVEQGRLRLDDPIGSVLPELAGGPVAAVTVAELLAHGGGVIRDSEDGDFWQLFHDFPTRSELLRIATEPSAAVIERNERFKYSNIGYGLLGLAIEAATGTSFRTAVTTAILDPLGLVDTGPDLEGSRRDEVAAGHTALAYATGRETIPQIGTAALAPATGFFSTAAELATFYSALLPGDARLLTADSQRLLRHPQWDVKGAESRYALGLFITRIGDHDLFGHSGGYPGHITRTLACPDRSVVVSVLTNAVDGPAEQLATAYFHLLKAVDSADHSPAESGARFTGRFASLWGVQDIALLGGRLFMINPTAPNPAEDPIPLQVIDDRTLKMVGGPGGGSFGELVRYDFAADGSVAGLRGQSGLTMRPFQPG